MIARSVLEGEAYRFLAVSDPDRPNTYVALDGDIPPLVLQHHDAQSPYTATSIVDLLHW